MVYNWELANPGAETKIEVLPKTSMEKTEVWVSIGAPRVGTAKIRS